jgi:hypothetical protein
LEIDVNHNLKKKNPFFGNWMNDDDDDDDDDGAKIWLKWRVCSNLSSKTFQEEIEEVGSDEK